MNARGWTVTGVALSLASCCPTLWIQVAKTDPAPWPEVAPPAAGAMVTPVAIPNRFDVLASPPGTVTRSEDGYRDTLLPWVDGPGQQTEALNALSHILANYHDQPLATCTTPAMPAVVSCEHADEHGLGANCDALSMDQKPPDAGIILIRGDAGAAGSGAGQYRVALAASPDSNNTWLVPLTERIDAADQERVEVCPVTGPALSKPLLSFIHLSDIQLRDPSVILTDRTLSKRLDWFQTLSSFEYDEDMAFYNQYVVEAMVETINASAARYQAGDPLRPSFVIHTGDSVDSNMMSELVRFHTIIDRLKIPFFEIFGNHDVLVFGDLTPTDTHASDATCSSVASLLGHETDWAPDKICVDERVNRCRTCLGSDVQLIASTKGQAETRRTFMDTLVHTAFQPVAEPDHAEVGDYCADTHPKVRNSGYSRAHGFDLGTKNEHLDGERLGYYAFAQKLAGSDGRHAVFIALDSEELAPGQGGVGGHIGHEQLAWLQNVLACMKTDKHRHDLAFVFAHQPLSMLEVDAGEKSTVAKVLESSPNVVGYLYGHNHRHSICGDGRTGVCSKFWEIETGSLIEFPQEGRLVRVKQVGQQLAFLEVSTFSEQIARDGSPMARYVALAHRGAERDYCVTAADVRCSADHRPYRTDGDSTAARLFFRMP